MAPSLTLVVGLQADGIGQVLRGAQTWSSVVPRCSSGDRRGAAGRGGPASPRRTHSAAPVAAHSSPPGLPTQAHPAGGQKHPVTLHFDTIFHVTIFKSEFFSISNAQKILFFFTGSWSCHTTDPLKESHFKITQGPWRTKIIYLRPSTMYLMQFGLFAVGTMELLAWFLSSSPNCFYFCTIFCDGGKKHKKSY